MLYVCYGAKKSGSTYVHNLTAAVLEAAGHPHVHISPEVRQELKPPKNEWANIVRGPDTETVEAIKACVPEGRIVTLRTHSLLSPALRDLIRSDSAQAQITIRDPRDIFLSYQDAKSRKDAQKLRKGEEIEADDAEGDTILHKIDRNVKIMTSWIDSGADPLVVNYETAAFDPNKTIQAICDQLRLAVSRDKWEGIYRQADSALHSKKNVAKPTRHVAEMPAEQQKRILDRYKDFYDRFFPGSGVNAER